MHAGSVPTTSLKVSENNGSSVFVELLRGRDGLPGRDGVQGSPGPQGKDGSPGPPGPRSGGATYTRWGKSTCPQLEGTEILYSGITGGTYYSQKGGGANYLCMPKDPEYSTTLTYRGGVNGYATIHGAEYQYPLQGSDRSNVPCAVCYVSTRPTVIMIPAKASCPSSWTREYYGYIMTERTHASHHRTMFECVDRDQEVFPASHAATNGAFLNHVEASCNGLPCDRYDPNKELNCVVCTK